MSFQNILLQVSEHIGYLTINRPEARNALNEDTLNEIIEALKQFNQNDEVRVIQIQGSGEKAFCAGGDLKNMMNNMKENSIIIERFTGNYARLIDALIHSKKPTIAVVQGYALAGGCGLAAVCDITIASEKATFGVPEINLGIWGAIISATLTRILGLKKAMELLYTGRMVKAEEAVKIGLANKVVPHEELQNEAKSLADSIAAKSPLAISMGREALIHTQDMELMKSIKYLRYMVTTLMGSEDAKEGIAAFLEKRKPVWKNQ